MSFKGFLKAIFVLLILGGVFVYGFYQDKKNKDIDLNNIKDDSVTVNIWYTDEALTDYLNSAALSFYEDTGIRINPVLYTSPEYIEAIYEASNGEDEDAIPDLYILGSDSLENAVMAGIALPVSENNKITGDNFGKVSLEAVTYKGDKLAYPLYFETAYLLYNKTFLHEIADSAVRMDIIDSQSGDEEDAGMSDITSASENSIPEGYTEESFAKAVDDKCQELVPESIEDILSLAEKYSAPAEVENIFIWDVSDIFYNYFFAGAYMNIGGENGDDENIMDIYTKDAVECLTVYQSLNQFFYIDALESSYSNVINDFAEGKTLFTIATSDAIRLLEDKVKDGSFTYEYDIAALPGVDAEHKSKGLSVTECVVVNAYSKNREAANLFASYIAIDDATNLYTRTGKMPALKSAAKEMDEVTAKLYDIYDSSVSLPKLIEFSNFWMELENTYMLIWDGKDPDKTLLELADKMAEKY